MGTSTVVYPPTSEHRTDTAPLFWLKIAATAGLLGALYLDVIADLASEWWTVDASSYGMLVPPITLYIAYLRRRITLSLPANPDARGLLLTFLGCLFFLGGRLSAEFFLSRISFVIVLAGLTWTFWGLPRFRTLLFPFILLGTMVPLPAIVYNTAAAPLQLFASGIAANLAQQFGVSVYRDGNVIHLANTSLGVAEACSGLNSLSALLVGSLLLGFLEDASVLGRVLLLHYFRPPGDRGERLARDRNRHAGRLQHGICHGLLPPALWLDCLRAGVRRSCGRSENCYSDGRELQA